MYKLAMLTCVLGGAMLGQEMTPDARLQNAAAVISEMTSMPDRGVPRDLLDRAQCVVVIPGLKKAAFGIGGQYGKGFVSCRRAGGGWGAPAAVRLEGGSFGFQLGGESTDIILLVMNRRGMDKLMSDKFTIGTDASAAAGPVGRTAEANTDVALHAEILSYSRSRGAFAGISLQGATLRPDHSEDARLYGRQVTNRDILEGRVPTPPAATVLTSALDRASMRRGTYADRPAR